MRRKQYPSAIPVACGLVRTSRVGWGFASDSDGWILHLSFVTTKTGEPVSESKQVWDASGKMPEWVPLTSLDCCFPTADADEV